MYRADRSQGRPLEQAGRFAEVIGRKVGTFRLVVFDWDGTAVATRSEDACALRDLLVALAGQGTAMVVVTGTSMENVARQLAFPVYPPAAGQVYVVASRGSDAFLIGADGTPARLWQRMATGDELRQLDAIAAGVQLALQARTGLPIGIIADRPNRRKIDLIPEPAWQEPPKEVIGELLQAVERRFRQVGLDDGLGLALALAREQAAAVGMPHARITTDAKHVEVGLTDKGDALSWVVEHLAPALGVGPTEILVVGDEFGFLGAEPGSDARMCLPRASGATFVSVGVEPAGVPPGIIHLPGGPATFQELLRMLVARPPAPTVPEMYRPTVVPGWTVVADGCDEGRQPEVEARLAIANGYMGSRSALSEDPVGSRPGTYVAGVFDLDDLGHAELVTAPDWRHLAVEIDGEPLALEVGEVALHRLVLDLRRGMSARIWRHHHPSGRITRFHEVRWASLADVHQLYQAAWIVPENYEGWVRVTCGLDGRVSNALGRNHLVPLARSVRPVPWLAVRTLHGAYTLALASTTDLPGRRDIPATALAPDGVTQIWVVSGTPDRPVELHRSTAVFTSRDVADPAATARMLVCQADAGNLLGAAARHVAAWQARWQAADIEIEGDAEAQQAIRFAIYHLIAAGNMADERVSIGARGLAGDGYQGHVFWDTEIYMLPFYVHTCPAVAKALLMYRFHTLPAARERAATLGYQGALYAWESADSGRDETPTSALGPDGSAVPVLTGRFEHHVAADVGYAIWRYWLGSGDADFMRDVGAEMLIEIARFWRSRATVDQGRYHIRDVIGPDEYHDHVDDNAYTNNLAAWVLLRSVEAVELVRTRFPASWDHLAVRLGFVDGECHAWQEIAAAIATGLDPETGLIEQFSGYFGLEEVDLAAFGDRHVPMCVVLDQAQLQRSKIIKQGDVVSLLHLLGATFPAPVVRVNYHYYEPRTAHDSSLCRSAYGLVAARLGLMDEALRFFRFTAAVDLSNDMGNGGLGVHMAAQGCLWQLVAHGFLGLVSEPDGVSLDPKLPGRWSRLTLPFQHQGWRLRVEATLHELELAVEGQDALQVRLGTEKPRLLAPGRHRARRNDPEEGWRWMDAS